MRIKVLAAAVLLGFGLTTGAFAFGIGAQFNGNASNVFLPGASLLVSPSDSTHLAINWYFGNHANTLGLTADFWFMNPTIASFSFGSLNFFLGGGGYGNLLLTDSGSSLAGGVRLPLGLQLSLNRRVLEFYIQLAPSLGVRFYPDFGGDNFFCPFALGFRFWFR